MGVRVLLVDDEAELRELWAEILEARGYAPVGARCVQDVRDLLAEGLDIGVAVVDWTLPDGRGSDVRALLRDGGITAPIVFASGLGPMLPEGHGGDAILAKPFRTRALVDLLDQLVAGSS